TPRVHGLAVASYLEVQHGLTLRPQPHSSNHLTGVHPVALVNIQSTIMTIGTQIMFIVLDDEQKSITLEPIATIHHIPAGGGTHRLTHLAANVETLRIRTRYRDLQQSPLSRPQPL